MPHLILLDRDFYDNELLPIVINLTASWFVTNFFQIFNFYHSLATTTTNKNRLEQHHFDESILDHHPLNKVLQNKHLLEEVVELRASEELRALQQEGTHRHTQIHIDTTHNNNRLSTHLPHPFTSADGSSLSSSNTGSSSKYFKMLNLAHDFVISFLPHALSKVYTHTTIYFPLFFFFFFL